MKRNHRTPVAAERACAAVLILFAGDASAWECSIALNAPKAIGIGVTKTLYASGTPEGGSYSWSNTPGLTASGDIATLLGFQPSYSDYISTRVTYTAPRGNRCSASKYIWVYDCDIRLSGPADMLVDDIATLIAKTYSHDPTGGVYTWSGPDDLLNLGGAATADFTPLLPGEAVITADYTEGQDPDICTSTASHTINVWPDCQLDIHGLDEVPLGDTVSLRGLATPDGGSFAWGNVTTVVPSTGNLFAYFEGTAPGNHTVSANYTTAEGYACKDPATHDIEVYKVASISGPVCANSGDVLTAGDYAIVTDPPGHESKATVSPELLAVNSPLSEVETRVVTASVSDVSLSDDANVPISVVNPGKQSAYSVALKIPNYVNKALAAIGIAETFDLSLAHAYVEHRVCCNNSFVGDSRSGETVLGLKVAATEITVVGIPVPKKAKDYVTLDLLAISVDGTASGSFVGTYSTCRGKTSWDGAGDLAVSVSPSAQLKAVSPAKMIVVEGKISGKTTVTEKIDVAANSLVLSGEWGGLDVAGSVTVIVGKAIEFSDDVTIPLLKKRIIPQVAIALPDMS